MSIARIPGRLFSAEIERRDEQNMQKRLRESMIECIDANYSRIEWPPDRLLDKARINTILALEWVRRKQHCIITGPTGSGKTWMAGAIVRQACLKGHKVKSYRLPTLLRKFARFQSAAEMENDGQTKFLQDLSILDLLHIDDWAVGGGLEMQPVHRIGLYEIIRHCAGRVSLLITGVPPVSSWAAFIGEPTIADVILDRIVKRSLRLELHGKSLRNKEEYGGIPHEDQADSEEK